MRGRAGQLRAEAIAASRVDGPTRYTFAVTRDRRPAADSQQLIQLEQRQRDEAPAPQAPIERECTRVRLPAGGPGQAAIPRSQALLERLTHGELIPREKKPFVVDTRRSCGPYLASVDEPPLVLLDACSQIATLTHGFAHPGILAGLDQGRFDDCLWANPDTTVEASAELEAYAERLVAEAPAGLTHVAYVGAGGAEANEKALRLARLHGGAGLAGRKRVLAFEGSFHGRTFVTLGATSNPLKRKGVDLDGYEALFCPRDLDALAELLAARGHEIYAALIEPMMAEGGDVHLTREFLLGVREQTRAHGIPLVVDEVQTGFGSGGTFFWWRRMGLGETPDTSPDLLTCAKRAGLGLVLSRWPDGEPTAVAVASALRGLIQAETATQQAELEAPIAARLKALQRRFPELVADPRTAGSSFAFDLPSAEHRAQFIAQRFARGLMTYHAGERTIRFRLGSCWQARELDELFARVGEALARLDDPTASTWVAEGQPRRLAAGLTVREVAEGDWPTIMAIERAAYEAERSDSEDFLRTMAAAGVALVACDATSGELLGFAVAAPLEQVAEVPGPREDPALGSGRGLYAADLTVAEAARGRGVGRVLKRAQLDWARRHGFDFVAGRNKLGATDDMAALNRSFGAYTAAVFDAQYGGGGRAAYYRIPLRAPSPRKRHHHARRIDLASGLQAPFGPRPAFMASRELVGPTASRLNLSNWATLDTVHYAEHLRAILPRGTAHLYTTSSRDELVDKALRGLKMRRPKAQLAVGFEGGYLGHNTAAARSLSDPAGFGPQLSLFDWPRLPHPERVGVEASVAALRELIAAHGAEQIIAVVVELVGERSGRVLDAAAARALTQLCRAHDLPLVLVETASGGYRSGCGPWALDGLPADVLPNLVLWYPGGQLGQIFIDSRWWVGQPLQLITTWDGDELSLIRTHEHLRAAHRLDLEPAIAALDAVLVEWAAALAAKLGEAPRLGGLGLYRSVTLPRAEQAEQLRVSCRASELVLGLGLPDTLIFAPPLDVAAATLRGPVRAALLVAVAATEAVSDG